MTKANSGLHSCAWGKLDPRLHKKLKALALMQPAALALALALGPGRELNADASKRSWLAALH